MKELLERMNGIMGAEEKKVFEKGKKEAKRMVDEAEGAYIVITEKGQALVGDGARVRSSLVMAYKNFIEKEQITKEELEEMLKLATMSVEELQKEALKKMKELFKKMGDK